MPRLDHNFTLRHNLDMLTEIRREREVELALEGFRYDDLRRWKIAEDVLPAEVLGAKFTQGEWGSVSPSALEDRVNEDSVFIIESAESRFFDPEKDYLYPIETLYQFFISHSHRPFPERWLIIYGLRRIQWPPLAGPCRSISTPFILAMCHSIVLGVTPISFAIS